MDCARSLSLILWDIFRTSLFKKASVGLLPDIDYCCTISQLDSKDINQKNFLIVTSVILNIYTFIVSVFRTSHWMWRSLFSSKVAYRMHAAILKWIPSQLFLEYFKCKAAIFDSTFLRTTCFIEKLLSKIVSFSIIEKFSCTC